MRILWHSAAPWINTGYGRCTREIAGRLHNGEHEVAIKPLSSLAKGEIWWHGEDAPYELEEPMKVYSSRKPFGLNTVPEDFADFGGDLYFTHFDTWMEVARKSIPEFGIPYSSYVIVDHAPVPNAVIQQVQNAQEVFAMSKYAKKEMEEKGTYSKYIPHGVNTEKYKPLPEDHDDVPTALAVQDDAGNRREVDLDETFLFGMVAANHADRKNIPGQMEAFKYFIENVDEDAVMYIHTEVNAQNGYNLDEVRQELEIPQENLIWADPNKYHNMTDEELNLWYNAFDVFLNCSMGESWGLTITEAQAAGTPCIVTNFSSMPEQLGVEPGEGYQQLEWVMEEKGKSRVGIADHGLVVDPDTGVWREKVSSKQFLCDPEDIYKAMKFYYDNDEVREWHGEEAREFVVDNYDWDEEVIPMWEEAFDDIEKRLQALS